MFREHLFYVLFRMIPEKNPVIFSKVHKMFTIFIQKNIG